MGLAANTNLRRVIVVSTSLVALGITTPLVAQAQGSKDPVFSQTKWDALCAKIGGTNPSPGYGRCTAAPGTSFKYAEVGVLETYCNNMYLSITVYPGDAAWLPLGDVSCHQNLA
jgi:hypothetical protein